MFLPCLKQFGLSVPGNLKHFTNLRVGEWATYRAQRQRFDQQLNSATVTENVNVRWRVVMHVDHETKASFIEDRRHGAV